MWNFSNNPMSWFGFGFGWIFMILFWALIVYGPVSYTHLTLPTIYSV